MQLPGFLAATLMLLGAPLPAPAAHPEQAPGNFAGIWDYSRAEKVDGKNYTVQYRYTIFQKGARVCGFLDNSGIGSARLDEYAFRGKAYARHVELWLDDGSPRSADYVPVYPFEATAIHRLQRAGNRLVLTHMDHANPARSLAFPPVEKIRRHQEIRLARLQTPPSSELPDETYEKFVQACLDDQSTGA